MRALPTLAKVFGFGAGLLGFEHGLFEFLQGEAPVKGPYISAIGSCDPATAWHACEPALTIVPSFLATGILAMLTALGVAGFTVMLLNRRRGATGFLVLVLALFLVGGGFFTLIFGVVAAASAALSGSTLGWWRVHLPPATVRVLGALWPALLVGFLGYELSAWVVGSLANDVMLSLTFAATALTPPALIGIVLAAIAHDIRADAEPPDDGPRALRRVAE